jgi:hypothetical protein
MFLSRLCYHRTVRLWAALPIMTVLMAALGCKEGRLPTYPVKGKVVYQGKPLANATVTLNPEDPAKVKDRHPTGITGEDGTFRISTYLYADGAPAGNYKVTVFLERMMGRDGTGQNILPAKYGSAASTPFSAVVEAPELDLGTLTITN